MAEVCVELACSSECGTLNKCLSRPASSKADAAEAMSGASSAQFNALPPATTDPGPLSRLLSDATDDVLGLILSKTLTQAPPPGTARFTCTPAFRSQALATPATFAHLASICLCEDAVAAKDATVAGLSQHDGASPLKQPGDFPIDGSAPLPALNTLDGPGPVPHGSALPRSVSAPPIGGASTYNELFRGCASSKNTSCSTRTGVGVSVGCRPEGGLHRSLLSAVLRSDAPLSRVCRRWARVLDEARAGLPGRAVACTSGVDMYEAAGSNVEALVVIWRWHISPQTRRPCTTAPLLAGLSRLHTLVIWNPDDAHDVPLPEIPLPPCLRRLVVCDASSFANYNSAAADRHRHAWRVHMNFQKLPDLSSVTLDVQETPTDPPPPPCPYRAAVTMITPASPPLMLPTSPTSRSLSDELWHAHPPGSPNFAADADALFDELSASPRGVSPLSSGTPASLHHDGADSYSPHAYQSLSDHIAPLDAAGTAFAAQAGALLARRRMRQRMHNSGREFAAAAATIPARLHTHTSCTWSSGHRAFPMQLVLAQQLHDVMPSAVPAAMASVSRLELRRVTIYDWMPWMPGALPHPAFTNLRDLTVTDTPDLSDGCLSHFRGLRNLRYLSIYHASALHGSSLQILLSLPLETLALVSCRALSTLWPSPRDFGGADADGLQAGHQDGGASSPWQHTMRRIFIQNCPEILRRTFWAALNSSRWDALEFLSVSGCEQFNEGLGRQLITEPDEVDGDAAQGQAARGRRRSLWSYLRGAPANLAAGAADPVAPAAAPQFAPRFPRLRVLDVSKTSLKRDSMQRMQARHMPSLRLFMLNDCQRVSWQDLACFEDRWHASRCRACRAREDDDALSVYDGVAADDVVDSWRAEPPELQLRPQPQVKWEQERALRRRAAVYGASRVFGRVLLMTLMYGMCLGPVGVLLWIAVIAFRSA